MADPWEEAAKQFKPSGDGSSPTTSGDDDWKVWQQNDAGTPSQRFATNDQPLFPKAAAAFRNLQEKVSPYIDWMPRAETLMGMAAPAGAGAGVGPALVRAAKAGGSDVGMGIGRSLIGHPLSGLAQAGRGIVAGAKALRAPIEPFGGASTLEEVAARTGSGQGSSGGAIQKFAPKAERAFKPPPASSSEPIPKETTPMPPRTPIWTGPQGAPPKLVSIQRPEIPTALPSGRIPGKPAIDTATGQILHSTPEELGVHGGVENTPIPKANGRVEPFAENQPFSPSKAARQQTPATAKGGEPTGVRGNPKAMSFAEKLKAELEKKE